VKENYFSNSGKQKEKTGITSFNKSFPEGPSPLLPSSEWTAERREAYPATPPLEGFSSLLQCSEWERAMTHLDDLSTTERAKLDKHLRLCSACRAVYDLDQKIDDLICTAFFGPSSSPELVSELPLRLQKIWEFQNLQENLALQKNKGTYAQYQPNEDSSTRKKHILAAKRTIFVCSQVGLFFSVLVSIFSYMSIYSVVTTSPFTHFTVALVETLKLSILPAVVFCIVLLVEMNYLLKLKRKEPKGRGSPRRRHRKHQNTEAQHQQTEQCV
jgi:hypothetical protein